MRNMLKRLNVIRNIEQARFDKASVRILWVESFVFAAIGFGIAVVAGGWVLGLMIFVNAVRLHFRDLRLICGKLNLIASTGNTTFPCIKTICRSKRYC